MTDHPHRLERSLVIRATPEAVFSFFTASERWARWWGAGSTIEPAPGGRVLIRHPNGVEVIGEVLEIDPPSRIAFTYGYASGTPFPPAGSRVALTLEPHRQGTLLRLTHEFADAEAREEHVQGWRFQLSLLANAVADLANAGAAGLIDDWFAMWSNPERASREAAVERLAADDISVQDRVTCTSGRHDLLPHLVALHRFMPGLRVLREGPVRHCQGAVLADWRAVGGDGVERGRGTSLFMLTPGQQVGAVTGFWA